MIPFIVLIVLSILTIWGTTLYLWWREETGTPVQSLTVPTITRKIDHLARIGRRGWYTVCRVVDMLLHKIGSSIIKTILRIAPRLTPAFTQKDVLTGLKHGPSSYFLMTISEKKAPNKKVAQ